MFGIKSPLENAYHAAVSNRLFSIVYFALNDGVPLDDRKSFRRVWAERGSYRLGELLLRCTCPDWADYPETFYVNPWIAEHLRGCEPGGLCFFLDRWLDNEPLPVEISADPRVEDGKVKELRRLFSALNP
jgi:hypothetical protein